MSDFETLRVNMVDTQVRPADVTKFPVIDAMLNVPREKFVPQSFRDAAYAGTNINLGAGRAMLEPRTLAKMLDALDLEPDELVLDVAAGSGYSSAVISRMAQMVIALEEDPGLAQDAQDAFVAAELTNVVVEHGALSAGTPDHAPFDAIVIEGGVQDLPTALIDQLKDGGRIVAPFVDGMLCEVCLGYKLNGQMNWRRLFSAPTPLLPGFERDAGFTF